MVLGKEKFPQNVSIQFKNLDDHGEAEAGVNKELESVQDQKENERAVFVFNYEAQQYSQQKLYVNWYISSQILIISDKNTRIITITYNGTSS